MTLHNPSAAEAIARAWHRVGCRDRNLLAFSACRYRAAHERTGREALLELAKDGYRVVREIPEAESVAIWGDEGP